MPQYRSPWDPVPDGWPEGWIVRRQLERLFRDPEPLSGWPAPDPPRRLGPPGMDRTDGADHDTDGDTVPE